LGKHGKSPACAIVGLTRKKNGEGEYSTASTYGDHPTYLSTPKPTRNMETFYQTQCLTAHANGEKGQIKQVPALLRVQK